MKKEKTTQDVKVNLAIFFYSSSAALITLAVVISAIFVKNKSSMEAMFISVACMVVAILSYSIGKDMKDQISKDQIIKEVRKGDHSGLRVDHYWKTSDKKNDGRGFFHRVDGSRSRYKIIDDKREPNGYRIFSATVKPGDDLNNIEWEDETD